jgi:ADP-ribose pyrophosphatase
LATARRELQEECGLSGGDWRELAAFWTTPGFCRERMHLFAADHVVHGEAAPEPDEDLELVRWPVAEIGERLGQIEDAKTLAGLLLYLRTRPQGSGPG